MEIEKTNRMNALFEFYSTLLTEKQMNYMELYYADDFSLGEIAGEYQVSRQAVYDNIKRTEKILEDYEKKLHLFSDYIVRGELVEQLATYGKEHYPKDEALLDLITQIQAIDEE
ncbi:MAG: putative DNA-binding protein [Enterococcus sp.]